MRHPYQHAHSSLYICNRVDLSLACLCPPPVWEFHGHVCLHVFMAVSPIYSKICRWVINLHLGLCVGNQFHLTWIPILATAPCFWLFISLHPAVLSNLCWHVYAPSRCEFQTFINQAGEHILSYLIVALLGSSLFALISITLCAQQSEWKKEKYLTLILLTRSETPQLLGQRQDGNH